jgi:pyruvate dehydrogenase E2 component (dihydrolipoamide acetyltransferase)
MNIYAMRGRIQTKMALVSLRIPQIGEGLQEARVVSLLKQPGDMITRDEPIYQMETDKAVMDVESPCSGRLVKWLAAADDVLAINAEVAIVESTDADAMTSAVEMPETVEETSVLAPESETGSAARNAGVPPRTRAYAREKGVSDDQLATIPFGGSKLMPADVDAFLADRAKSDAPKPYSEVALAGRQRIIASRLVRSNQLVVPGTMSVTANWEPIEALRAEIKSHRGDFQPSTFTIFAYAVTLVMKQFPAFRTTLVGDSTLRTYDHVNLAVAVALPGDGLTMAVVEKADLMSWPDFVGSLRERIQTARNGVDQINEQVAFSLTNMQGHRLRDAVPVVVAPMVGTLFIGEVYNGLAQGTRELQLQRCCNLGLTFDHRVINGVGAADFLNAIRDAVENISNHIVV